MGVPDRPLLIMAVGSGVGETGEQPKGGGGHAAGGKKALAPAHREAPRPPSLAHRRASGEVT